MEDRLPSEEKRLHVMVDAPLMWYLRIKTLLCQKHGSKPAQELVIWQDYVHLMKAPISRDQRIHLLLDVQRCGGIIVVLVYY